MKLLWITNIPSPYRVDFFNEIGKECDVVVVFEKNRSQQRANSWHDYRFINFVGIFLKDVDRLFSLNNPFKILKYLKKNSYDYIIVTNYSTLMGIIAIEYMRLRKIRYIIEGDGGFPKKGGGIKEKTKSYLLKGADRYFSTGVIHDQYYIRYGADSKRILRYPFTSVFKNDVLERTLKEIDKDEIKAKYGIQGKKVVIAVGQFIYRKGFDILIKASKEIQADTAIYIVGGKPTADYINLAKTNNINNIYFIEHLDKETLKQYYRASDLFVLPTRNDIWGLVINEAMANALPIITTDKCIAGIELVEDEGNGFIVPAENIGELSRRVNMVLDDDIMRRKMSARSLEIIGNYTIENMVRVHMNYFNSSS